MFLQDAFGIIRLAAAGRLPTIAASGIEAEDR
jgi:hypothetical protein